MEDQPKNLKAVYTVVERGQGKSFWVRVGIGFTNRDGSLNLKLDAIPVNGSLQVREWEPAERRPELSDAGTGQAGNGGSHGRLKPARDPNPESLV